MARDDAQLKIRLPASLKERLALRAQRTGRSMNAEIVELVEEALSQHTYEISDARLSPAHGRPSDDDLEYEIEQLNARIDVISEDFFMFAEKLSDMKGEAEHDIFLRQMRIRRMSELEAEREKLWERVKFLTQILRRSRARAKNLNATIAQKEDGD